jgi:SNF2 family DNA or RNA helicase
VKRLLADQMGLGKTWIALHLIPQGWGAILTGPVNAKEVWAQHVAMLRPEMTIKKLKSRKEFDLPVSNEAVIGNYEQIEGSIGALAKYHPNKIVLIIDEIHLIKSPNAKRTKDIRKLAENIRDQGGLVYGLTGTAVLNGESLEIWNHLVTLGIQDIAFPGGFPEMCKLGGMGKITVPNGRGGFVDTWKQVRDPQPEFAERLRRVMLRRTRKDVFKDTPAKVYHKILIPLEGAKGRELRALLESLRKDLVRYGNRDILEVMGDPLVLETFSIIRKASADLKITEMFKWIAEHEENFPREGDFYPEPLLVASAHVEPIESLRKLPGWRIISGAVKSEERGEIAQEFRDGKLAGVGFTIAAGGEGINLCRQGARRMLFVDCDWRPGKMSQAEDRLRPHQLKESCEYSYLVLDHPLEVKVWETLMRKKDYNEKAGLGE